MFCSVLENTKNRIIRFRMSLKGYFQTHGEHYFKNRSPVFFVGVFVLSAAVVFLLFSLWPLYCQMHSQRNAVYAKNIKHYNDHCNEIPTNPTTDAEYSLVQGCNSAQYEISKPVWLVSLIDLVVFIAIMPIYYWITSFFSFVFSPFSVFLTPFVRLFEQIDDSMKIWGMILTPLIILFPFLVLVFIGFLCYEWFKQGVPAFAHWIVTRKKTQDMPVYTSKEQLLLKNEYLLPKNASLLDKID